MATKRTSQYTSIILEELKADLKKQLGDDLVDAIELLIDEKIRIGIQSTEQRFQALLDKKKNI